MQATCKHNNDDDDDDIGQSDSLRITLCLCNDVWPRVAAKISLAHAWASNVIVSSASHFKLHPPPTPLPGDAADHRTWRQQQQRRRRRGTEAALSVDWCGPEAHLMLLPTALAPIAKQTKWTECGALVPQSLAAILAHVGHARACS